MLEYFNACPVASVIFVVTILMSLVAFSNENLYNRLMLKPYDVYRGKQIYTVITSGFIHADWMHLLFNMVTYFSFAFTLEQLIGHWQFALLYFVSLILSDMPSVIKHKNDVWYRSLGASGAISAVLFACILFFPLNEIYVYFIRVPAILFGVLYLVYCWYASKQSRDTINHDAHFFGAISGIFITIVLRHDVLSIFAEQLRMGLGR